MIDFIEEATEPRGQTKKHSTVKRKTATIMTTGGDLSAHMDEATKSRLQL